MALTTNLELQREAQRGKYAVGAFNTSNLEITQAILEAAVECRSPVIVATSQSAIKYAGMEALAGLIRTLARPLAIPVSLHLDHGTDYDIIIGCLRHGWTSVMIDGSHAPLEENIAITAEIVKVAHAASVSVEAELGRLFGIEDHISVQADQAHLTEPEEAVRFVSETACDTLAVAIGTSHGAYKFKGKPQLDFDRLKAIVQKVETPLVLHGASSVKQEMVEKGAKYGAKLSGAAGVPEEHIRKAVSLGITKINIDTDLRLTFTTETRKFLAEQPEVFDPRKILAASRQAMKEVIKEKIELLGSADRA